MRSHLGRKHQRIARFFKKESQNLYTMISQNFVRWHIHRTYDTSGERQQSQGMELLIHVRFSPYNNQNVILPSVQGASSQLQVLSTEAIKSSDRSKNQEGSI